MKAKIRKWFDGDSGQFTGGQHFRLASVNAPERHQFGGTRVKHSVAGMTGRSHGTVNATVLGRDFYGRLLVNLSNRDGSINQRMRRKGYL